MKKLTGILLIATLVVSFGAMMLYKSPTAQTIAGKTFTEHEVGDAVDSLNGVPVYYNGAVANTGKRHLAADGYNYGLRWQCVEFVKRYYYDYLRHKMPDSYGHAKDFFDADIADGTLNKKRNLIQYKNGSQTAPKENDLLVFDGHSGNPYGHVAIVSKAGENEIELIQQNPGPVAPSRETYKVEKREGKWVIDRDDLLGWLRVQTE